VLKTSATAFSSTRLLGCSLTGLVYWSCASLIWLGQFFKDLHGYNDPTADPPMRKLPRIDLRIQQCFADPEPSSRFQHAHKQRNWRIFLAHYSSFVRELRVLVTAAQYHEQREA
jgi:hypothetical protein